MAAGAIAEEPAVLRRILCRNRVRSEPRAVHGSIPRVAAKARRVLAR